MPGVILAAPGFAPPPLGSYVDWGSVTHQWQAWDGSLWDLSSGESGVYLRAGVVGMTMPPIIRYSQKSAAVAGSLYRGSIADERPVLWPLKLFKNSGSQDWINHNRAWWKTLHPDKVGTWIVQQPGGEYRTLNLRFTDDGNFAWGADDPDPEIIGFANYAFSFIAEQPFWQGAPISINWSASTAIPFFSASGSVLGISSANAVFGARIANPGSTDAWPVYTVRGPFTAASVGVGTNQITLPFTRTASHYVIVNTDPTAQTAVDDLGADVTGILGSVDFAPVPPGNPSQLAFTMTGAGSVDCTIIPNYFTATAN